MIAFSAIALLAAVDVVMDVRVGTTARHVAVEAAAFALAASGAVVAARMVAAAARKAAAAESAAAAATARERDAEARVAGLAEHARTSDAEAAKWRAEHRRLMEGLGAALDRQFASWGLSSAEHEVALLLLKGLSHQEIADTRAVTEATARQQARAVYRKAGVAGRSELAAYFFEDLLLPGSVATVAGASDRAAEGPASEAPQSDGDGGREA